MPEPVTLAVRAHPRAAAPSIGPWQGGILHVRVTRPPAGERGRTKRFEIDGLAAAELATRLASFGTRLGD